MAHSKGQKDKIRKSGRSLQNKTVKLGQHCGIFSALIYWNPTHQRMETVMHLPPGQTLPDVNKLLHRSAIDDARSPAARRAAQPSDFHHDLIAEGDSNADATTDIENEAGYNCAQGHTADIGLPSIHVIPDEEDGAMVAPHENRGQRRPFQQEQRGAYRPAVGRPPSSSGSSVTMDNEDHVAAANGHAHDRMDAFLQADIRRNHQRPRWPARALFSTRPTKERRVALDRAGGTSRQYVAAGLRRRDGGLRRAPIGDAEGSRMQRDSLAGKFLGLLDELASRMDTARA